jgi:hypothetical protein
VESILPLIIQAIGGLVGGNAIGAISKQLSAGGALNSIVGLIGGVAGGQLLGGLVSGAGEAAAAAGEAAGGLDFAALLGDAGTGAAGGVVLTAIVGIVKNMMAK